MTTRLLVAVGLLLAGTVSAHGASHAVVIGNSNYAVAPLANAARDAELVAARLAAIGFEVTTHYDLTFAEFAQVRAQIDDILGASEIGIVYYAGHAVQIDGVSHLLPIDVTSLGIDEIEAKKLPLAPLVEEASTGESGLRLVIIDACRNDPFSALSDRIGVGLDTEAGLSMALSSKVETLIAYSASSGQLASDGPPGGNGPFALALDRQLTVPGLELTDITRRVASQVTAATDARQIPWVSGSVRNEYWLNDREILRPPQTPEPELDAVLWWFLATTTRPVDLQRFQLFFPKSDHVAAARARFAQLRALPASPPSPSAKPPQPLAQPGAPIHADLFRVNRDELPDARGGLRDVASPCDWMAADFADPQRLAPGVRAGLIRLEAAVQACIYALRADPGNPRLEFQLARLLQTAGLHDWARHFYTRAARRGYSAALTNLGFMYTRAIGVARDHALAHRYYREAATLGNLRARTNIGTQFRRGHGVAQDPVEGVAWYRLASESGWVNAQNALADAYRHGEGVDQDHATAAALYELAALNGQRAAMHNLGRLLLRGDGVPADRRLGRVWLERGVLAGDRFAPFTLARDVVDTGDWRDDPGRVIALLKLSWQRGNPRALIDLARAYDAGEIVPRDAEVAFRAAARAQARDLDVADLVTRLEAELGVDTATRLRNEIAEERALNGR